MTSALLASILTLVGGSALGVMGYFWLPKAKQADIATQIREELRGDNQGLRDQITDVQNEMNYYKGAWFKMTEFIIKSGLQVPPELLEPYRKSK